jgi:hypothetical protein
MGIATLLNKNIGINESSFTIDLTNCYTRDVSSYTRKILLNKSTTAMTVKDEFVSKDTSIVWWGMHTKADITIRPKSNSALLQQNGKKMLVTIKSPSNAVFQVLDASYLPDELFPFTRNSLNVGFKKLAIHLPKVLFEKIEVIFQPQ